MEKGGKRHTGRVARLCACGQCACWNASCRQRTTTKTCPRNPAHPHKDIAIIIIIIAAEYQLLLLKCSASHRIASLRESGGNCAYCMVVSDQPGSDVCQSARAARYAAYSCY